MNYITEINKFYDWLETNPVSDSSIVLWHALMHINNKCGWKQEFAVAISSIQNKTGLSKSSILRARNILQQYGRVNFKSRDGQQSAVYTIIAFHCDAQSGTQTGAQTMTQSGTQTGAIPKVKETKQNKKHSSPVGENKNPFWKSFVAVFNDFYKEKTNEDYKYLNKDFGCLNKIYSFLQDRAKQKKQEWTEELMKQSFDFFLKKAWEKDDWLRQNFSIPNALSQFNQITKENINGSKINGKSVSANTAQNDQLNSIYSTVKQAVAGS